MVRKHLLKTLIEHSRLARDLAANEAAGARRRSQQADAMLDTLRGYRRDYDSKAPKQRRTPIDARAVRQHESFVGTLDVALGEQATQQTRLAQASAVKDATLVARRRRLKAFEMLLERQQRIEHERRARLEQMLTDEQATRSALRSAHKKVP
jgi:flagellar protein FliJ